MTNSLQRLVKLYPEKPWNWYGLTANPAITLEFIQANPELPWKRDFFVTNPNVTWDYIRDNGLLNSIHLSRNPNITWDNIQESLGFPGIIHKPMVVYTPPIDQPICWDWAQLLANSNITWETIRGNPIFDYPLYHDHHRDWNWAKLSANSSITWEIYKANSDLPWKRYYISTNPSITPEIVRANPITPQDNRNGTDLQTNGWDWEGLSVNPNTTWEFVRENPKPLTYSRVWGNRGWDPLELTRNPNMTLDIIRNNPFPGGLEWCIRGLSMNPNITWEYVRDNPVVTLGGLSDSWNWAELSLNRFECHPVVKRRQERRIALGKRLIPLQTKVREWYWNPLNTNMIRRLEESFDRLVEEDRVSRRVYH